MKHLVKSDGITEYSGEFELLQGLVSNRMLDVFVLPKYLHDIETINMQITEVKLLNNQHANVLNLIQHWPDRTPVEAGYYLLGQLPIEVILDQQRLNLFEAMCRGQGVERQIAIGQLANKDIKSHKCDFY